MQVFDRGRVALGGLVREGTEAFFGVACHGFIECSRRLFAPFFRLSRSTQRFALSRPMPYPLYRGMFRTLGPCAFSARTTCPPFGRA